MYMTVTVVKVGQDVRAETSIVGVDFESTTKCFFGNILMLRCWQLNHDKVYAMLAGDILSEAKKAVIFFNASSLKSVEDVDFWMREFESYANRPDILLYGTTVDGAEMHPESLYMAEHYAARARKRNQLGKIYVSSDRSENFNTMYDILLWKCPHNESGA